MDFFNQINITIDLNARRKYAPQNLKEVVKFGKILYYIVHNYNQKDHMLALIHFTTEVITDEYGLKYFEGYSHTKFIEIIGIDHCVGFLSFRPSKRKTVINYIIDDDDIDL
jgi:hypothetical protein